MYFTLFCLLKIILFCMIYAAYVTIKSKRKKSIAVFFMFTMIGRNYFQFSYKAYTAPTKYFPSINWTAVDFDHTLDIQIFLN